jgi:hypothetical protein
MLQTGRDSRTDPFHAFDATVPIIKYIADLCTRIWMLR